MQPSAPPPQPSTPQAPPLPTQTQSPPQVAGHDINTGPLDYNDSALLMNDMEFRGRVKVACLHFATYIQGEPTNIPAHNTRYGWAKTTIQNPDNAAMNVTPAVVQDPNVQSKGKSITDAELQTATETAVNNWL